MLRFEQLFQVREDKIPGATSEVAVVGRCEGNCVLVSYEVERDGTATVVSEYNLETHGSKELLVEQGRHHVSSASIDTTGFLLGVTFREEEPGEGYTYVTRIAEVSPMRRVFRLGEPTWELQRLIFLPQRDTKSDTYFLFFIHHREIIMYRTGLTGDPQCLSVSSQPVPSQLTDTFAWAELDTERSLLYHATVTPDMNRKVRMTALRLSYGASGDTQHDHLFSIDLQLPQAYDLIGGELSYAERQPTPRVSVECLNLCVRTMQNGTVCFCMQFSGLLAGEGERPEYGVFMLNNGHFLHCQLPAATCDTTTLSRVYFMECNHLLLAFLPNRFLHVLNCSGEFELYHHLVATGPHLPQWHGGTSCVDVSGDWLVSWDTGGVYAPRFDCEGLLRLFKETSCSRNQLAIVHIAIIYLDNQELVPDIIRETTLRAQQLVATDIFVEFLLAHPYASIRKSVPVKIQRSLPVTASSAFYHAVHYREGSSLLATFLASRIGGISGNILEIPEGVSPLMDLTKNNYYIVRFGRSRFSPKGIMQGYLTGDGSVIKVVETLCQQSQTKRRGIMGLFDSLRKSNSGSAPFTPSAMDEGAIAFLRDVAREMQPNLLMSQVQWERLLAYLTPYIIIRDNEESLESIVSRFVSLQHEASRKLLLSVWASLELRPEEDPLSAPLLSEPTERTRQLYHAIEKYYLAARELSYPLPKGFSSLFCCLAFRHLKPRQFATHVELELLPLTEFFYEKLDRERVGDKRRDLCRVLMGLKEN